MCHAISSTTKGLALVTMFDFILFSNHPLSHLMQSVFSFHDRNKFQVHVYATSPSDGSSFRRRIEADSDQFLDVSSWSAQSIVERIVSDQIHIRAYSLVISGAIHELCTTSHQLRWLY